MRSRSRHPPSGTVKGDGSGETIALVEAYHDPNLVSDLHTFDQEFNLPDPVLTVNTQKGAKSNVGWAAEESLDVEWAHAIAPAANILVVEAKSQSIRRCWPPSTRPARRRASTWSQ